MKTIWKYPVQLTDRFAADLPQNARILTVDTQQGDPQMWFHVDTDEPVVRRHFAVVGTGHQMPVDCEYPTYMGSFQLANGNLVFHVFMVS